MAPRRWLIPAATMYMHCSACYAHAPSPFALNTPLNPLPGLSAFLDRSLDVLLLPEDQAQTMQITTQTTFYAAPQQQVWGSGKQATLTLGSWPANRSARQQNLQTSSSAWDEHHRGTYQLSCSERGVVTCFVPPMFLSKSC